MRVFVYLHLLRIFFLLVFALALSSSSKCYGELIHTAMQAVQVHFQVRYTYTGLTLIHSRANTYMHIQVYACVNSCFVRMELLEISLRGGTFFNVCLGFNKEMYFSGEFCSKRILGKVS